MYTKILKSIFYDKWFVLVIICLCGYISFRQYQHVHIVHSIIQCENQSLDRFFEAKKEALTPSDTSETVYLTDSTRDALEVTAWESARTRYHTCLLLAGILDKQSIPDFESYFPKPSPIRLPPHEESEPSMPQPQSLGEPQQ